MKIKIIFRENNFEFLTSPVFDVAKKDQNNFWDQVGSKNQCSDLNIACDISGVMNFGDISEIIVDWQKRPQNLRKSLACLSDFLNTKIPSMANWT